MCGFIFFGENVAPCRHAQKKHRSFMDDPEGAAVFFDGVTPNEDVDIVYEAYSGCVSLMIITKQFGIMDEEKG